MQLSGHQTTGSNRHVQTCGSAPPSGWKAELGRRASVAHMPNRLAASTSPYLLQHKDNPVDWWPWSAEALAEANRRDVPILLSVGYAACHWCHVMAHDSFEDAATAALMNENFVNIKVDREERPDIDAVYMEATTALTGQGGWPMTCLLTPDGSPFFAGTFFPRAQFQQLLGSVARAWRDDRAEVLAAGQRIVTALGEVPSPEGGSRAPGPGDLDAAAERLSGGFDRENGGFGRAPKFPPSMALEFLLRHHERTRSSDALAHSRRHMRGDGPRWDVRPAGRRLRALQRGRRLGGAAFREDALRQRPVAARLRALVAADRVDPGAANCPRDSRIPAPGPAHTRGRVCLGP